MWVSVRVCRFVVVVVVVSTFVQALLLLLFLCAIVFFLFTAFFALFFLDIGFDFLLWLFRRRRHRCRFLFAMSRLLLCFFSRVFGSFFFSLMNFSHTQNWCDCMILKWQTDCCYTICCYFFFLALSFSLCILSIEMLHSFLIFVVCFFHSRLRFAITNFVLPNRIYWHFIIIIMKYERQWDAVFRTTATKAVFAVIFSVRFDSKAEQQQQQRKTVRPSTKWKNRFAFHWISIWANFVAKIHNFPLFQLKFIDALVIYIANEAAKKSIKYGILNRWMKLLMDNWTKYKLKIGWLLLVSVFPPHRHF